MDYLSKNYQETILVNDEYLESLINDINSAKKTIDMETYIFAADQAL